MSPFIQYAERVEKAISKLGRPITVAVMGCEVNGPGEAKQADVGIAMGRGRAAIFKHGEIQKTVPFDLAFDVFIDEYKPNLVAIEFGKG